MRTALVAIGRLENRYAVEWVEHHIAIGFDHVFVYDNNHDGEERFEDVLQPLIDAGKVDVIPYRNRENAQRDAYNEAYWRFSSSYDWLAYFDFDEFLCLKSKNLEEFLQGIPATYDAVMVPWLNMTDNGLVRYDPRPVMERFTESTDNGRQQGKCIIRTGIPGALFTKSVHIPYEPELKCCDPQGRPAAQNRHQPKDTTVAYIKHFSTKTIEEWITNKWRKGAAGVTYHKFTEQYKNYFFSINERTPEKEEFIKHHTNMEKIALCAIGRRENQYAPEWVEHYRRMGFDHIHIYDNNREGEEHFEDVLGTYVSAGFVTIVDWRDHDEMSQLEVYNDCIRRNGNRYEWMAFLDFDEFLVINDGGDIHDFVRQRKDFDCILVNWMDMTDSGLVRYDPRPLMERFTEPMEPDRRGIGGDFPENNHVKSIVRCGIYGLEFRKNPHVPTVPALRCCNADGKEVKQKARIPYTHATAYLKHFSTKTIEEWMENKMTKGAAGITYEDFVRQYADFFFKVNERTPEKEAFIKEWNAGGHVAALALGRLGNQMFIACAARKLARDTGRQFAGLAYNDTSKKPREWDYPEGQAKTVMRRVKYVEPETLQGYHRMERGRYLSNGLPAALPYRDILLNDYFQDARCIDREDALQLFAPTKAMTTEIKRLYGDISDCVCVNVRRGDYLQHERNGFRVLTADQIRNILDVHFPDCKRVLFVSDDIPWCRDNFKGERYVFADKHKEGRTWPPAIDLYIQTMCRANVISNSTFSWWGAYLNKKAEKVVCPWPWFSPASGKPPMPNILPDGWVSHQTSGVRIWTTYHDDSLVREYALHDDERHQLFATHKPAPLENVNNLNPVWSEMVTMWYVWHNRLYSPRVGFAHYRRDIEPSRLPNEGECAIYHTMRTRQGETIRDQYARCHNAADIDMMTGLIDRRHGEGNTYTKHIKEGTTMVTNCCFILNWQDFMGLGDFLFPLLDDFAKATGCGRDVDKWREKAQEDFHTDDNDTVTYQMRLQGFLAERLISAYITTHFKCFK